LLETSLFVLMSYATFLAAEAAEFTGLYVMVLFNILSYIVSPSLQLFFLWGATLNKLIVAPMLSIIKFARKSVLSRCCAAILIIARVM